MPPNRYSKRGGQLWEAAEYDRPLFITPQDFEPEGRRYPRHRLPPVEAQVGKIPPVVPVRPKNRLAPKGRHHTEEAACPEQGAQARNLLAGLSEMLEGLGRYNKVIRPERRGREIVGVMAINRMPLFFNYFAEDRRRPAAIVEPPGGGREPLAEGGRNRIEEGEVARVSWRVLMLVVAGALGLKGGPVSLRHEYQAAGRTMPVLAPVGFIKFFGLRFPAERAGRIIRPGSGVLRVGYEHVHPLRVVRDSVFGEG